MTDSEKGFDEAREAAIETLRYDHVDSFYVGLVYDDENPETQFGEYRFAVDSDDPRVRSDAAVGHAATALVAMAEQSGADLEEVGERALE
ncbi:hypothetical protein ACFQE1_12725, partial [Halobium palmae]